MSTHSVAGNFQEIHHLNKSLCRNKRAAFLFLHLQPIFIRRIHQIAAEWFPRNWLEVLCIFPCVRGRIVGNQSFWPDFELCRYFMENKILFTIRIILQLTFQETALFVRTHRPPGRSPGHSCPKALVLHWCSTPRAICQQFSEAIDCPPTSAGICCGPFPA
jgi:hypothetical protein